MKVKRMGILIEILRKISSESFSKQPTQIIMELNSSLRHIIVTLVSSYLGLGLLRIDWVMTQAKNPSKFFKCSIKKIKSWQFHDNFKCLFIGNSQNWLRNVECKNWITSILCIVHIINVRSFFSKGPSMFYVITKGGVRGGQLNAYVCLLRGILWEKHFF